LFDAGKCAEVLGDGGEVRASDFIGGQVRLVDDVVDGAAGEEVAVDEPWEVVTPTALIQLQTGTELNPPA